MMFSANCKFRKHNIKFDMLPLVSAFAYTTSFKSDFDKCIDIK